VITVLGPSVILVIAGCASDDAGDEVGSAPVVRDSAGITIVENTAAEPRGVERWMVDTAPSVSIGAYSGDPAYELGYVRGARWLPDGMIVVLNGQGESAYELRFFDSTGKHIVTRGRRGQGPEEFRSINFFGSAGGDTVVAVDWPNGRLAWVSASRGWLRSVRVDEQRLKRVVGDDAYGMVETMAPLQDSVFAVKAFRPKVPPGAPGERSNSFHIIDVTRDRSVDLGRHDDPPRREVRMSSGSRMGSRPVESGEPVHVVDRSRARMCVAITTATQLTCADAAGRRTIIRWVADSISYTAEDRKASEQMLRQSYVLAGRPIQDAEAMLAIREYPTRFRPFQAVQVDTEGNFWIQELWVDAGGKRTPRFRVVSPEGRVLAFANYFPLRVIGSSTNVHIGPRGVLRVFEDADGVPKVGVFRVRRGG
jgi:hypothetical protein